MTLTEWYDEVAWHADTEKTKINVADVKRVLSEAFKVLVAQDAATVADLVAKGLAGAKKKVGK